MLRAFFTLFAAVALVGCDLSEESFEPQVVVEGFLIAGETLPAIRLSETTPIEEGFVFEDQAIRDAEVRITMTTGDEEEVYDLVEDANFPGNYIHPLFDPAPRVVPGARYRLEARLPGRPDLLAPDEVVRAETVVPGLLSVVRPPPDTVRYNVLTPGPAIDVALSSEPDRQSVFIFTVTALEPESYDLTPTLADLLENSDADPADFVDSASPILNEDNYDRNEDGTLRIRVPWLAIAYYGPNLFVANALDDAVYDYLRSRDAQFNPTTLSPGEIQRVLSNVENGVGVFGSLARASVEVFIEE